MLSIGQYHIKIISIINNAPTYCALRLYRNAAGLVSVEGHLSAAHDRSVSWQEQSGQEQSKTNSDKSKNSDKTKPLPTPPLSWAWNLMIAFINAWCMKDRNADCHHHPPPHRRSCC